MEMERRLYNAAVKGDVKALRELEKEDELVVDRASLTCFNETPLHIAAMRGHLDFVKEILKHRNLQLTKELDLGKSSPLHVASVRGHLEMVKTLVEADPDMCLAGDRDGRNPLHLAAIKGRVEVLKLLVQKKPLAAYAKTKRGETILLLCVKHDQLEALKIVLRAGSIDYCELESSSDDDGNTILHLATIGKQIETIKYLVSRRKNDLNVINGRGETALDILSQSQRDVIDLEISDILREAGAVRAKDLHACPSSSGNNHHAALLNQETSNPSLKGDLPDENHRSRGGGGGDWLARKRDSIMVVASLIATMAFQAGLNPAGGVWQDNHLFEDPTKPEAFHKAGESVMAYHHPKSYRYFVRANTIAFVSSLSTILLLISGLPFRHRLFLWILMVIMWLTVTTVALTYAISIVVVTPENQEAELSNVIDIAVTVWCGVMGLLLLGNTIRLILRSLKKKGSITDVWPPSKWRKSTGVHHARGGQETVEIQLR